MCVSAFTQCSRIETRRERGGERRECPSSTVLWQWFVIRLHRGNASAHTAGVDHLSGKRNMKRGITGVMVAVAVHRLYAGRLRHEVAVFQENRIKFSGPVWKVYVESRPTVAYCRQQHCCSLILREVRRKYEVESTPAVWMLKSGFESYIFLRHGNRLDTTNNKLPLAARMEPFPTE